MSKHTPGPWTVEPSDSGDASVGLAPTPPVVFTTLPNREDRSIEIAVVGTTIYDNSEDGYPQSWGDPDANANLIAAAPDLLTAVHAALSYIVSRGDLRAGTEASGLQRLLRAAIAKAEGVARG